MHRFKALFLFLILSLMFSPQVFAARGVDYNGHGNPVTISSDATGLTVGTGQSIFLANGSAFVTGAGALTLPGASTIQSLRVAPGNVTITAGSISLTAGGLTASAGTLSAGTITSTGALTAGNGLKVTSGSTTITAGNLTLSDGNASASGSLTAGNGLVVSSGNVTVTAGNISIPAGSLTASADVNAGAVNAGALGVTYDTGLNGKLTVGNGVLVSSGSTTITAGNLIMTNGYIQNPSGTWYISGTATTRDAARLSTNGQAAPIGSLYLSTGGVLYFKVANSNATSDYERVSTTAGD